MSGWVHNTSSILRNLLVLRIGTVHSLATAVFTSECSRVFGGSCFYVEKRTFFFFSFFEEEGTRQLDRSDFVLQFVVWMECTDGEDGGVSVLIELVM